MSTGSALRELEPPCHAVPELPADVMDALLCLAASNDAKSPRPDPSETRPDRQPYFEIYRAEQVSLTSVLFSGGDWRWCFCSSSGTPIANGAGYGSKNDCAAAVAALRNGAGGALVRSGRSR